VEYDARRVCFLSSLKLAQDSATRVAARVLTLGQLRRRYGTGSLPALKERNLTVDVIRGHESG